MVEYAAGAQLVCAIREFPIERQHCKHASLRQSHHAAATVPSQSICHATGRFGGTDAPRDRRWRALNVRNHNWNARST